MEPRIQYVTAPDGTNLAFCAEGQGHHLVMLPATVAFGNFEIEGLVPETRRALEYLRQHFRVIRHDFRGQGYSDREITDNSLGAHLGDVLTILDRLGAERFVIYGRLLTGPLAIALAHAHPDRISHLVLGATAPRGAEIFGVDRFRAMTALLEADWELYTSVAAMLLAGWSEPDVTTRLVSQMRAGTSAERVWRARDGMRAWDTGPFLGDIRVPTLVMDYRTEWAPVAEVTRHARRMASAIPGAHLLVLEDSAQAARAVHEFVTGKAAAPESAQPTLPEGTTVVLMADIVDSTALTEQLGDAAFRDRASRLDAAMRSAVRDCGGTPIEGKVMGDGVMAVFAAARQAIDGAFRCRAAADGTGLALHLGIHAGDVIREQNNVFGGAVNIAARISGLSAPGEVLVSDIVRGLARTSAGVTFEDRGEQALKGVGEPVRVFAVRRET